MYTSIYILANSLFEELQVKYLRFRTAFCEPKDAPQDTAMAVDDDAALQQALLLSTTDSAPCAQDLRGASLENTALSLVTYRTIKRKLVLLTVNFRWISGEMGEIW